MVSSLANRIISLGWPVLIAQLAVMANSVIDTIMAGHYSARAQAVVGLGSSIYMSIFVTLMGVLIALTPITAQHFGAGRHEAITHDVRQGLWTALLMTAIGETLLYFPEPFLALSGMNADIASDVRNYLRALMWAAPAMFLFRLFNSFSTSISQPRAVMVIQLLGLALKVPLNWLLMYGAVAVPGLRDVPLLGGIPALGGIGCAWALAIEAWLMLGAALIWLRLAPGFHRYRIFARPDAIDWRAQWQIIKLGLPISGSFLIDVTSYTFMALFIARLGESHSAAQQIAANLGALAYMVPLAISTASAVVVGQLIGAGDVARARAAGWTGLGIGLAAALTVALLILTFHLPLTRLYTRDADVAALAAPLALMVAVFHIFDATNAVAANNARAYKKAVVPMIAFALALWVVGLGGGYWLAFAESPGAPRLQAQGFWIGAIGGMALSAMICTFYFARLASASRRT
jgi:multidrug resistance protein, MATE family